MVMSILKMETAAEALWISSNHLPNWKYKVSQPRRTNTIFTTGRNWIIIHTFIILLKKKKTMTVKQSH